MNLTKRDIALIDIYALAEKITSGKITLYELNPEIQKMCKKLDISNDELVKLFFDAIETLLILSKIFRKSKN